MGVKSLQELNKDYLRSRDNEKDVRKKAFDILFWILVFLIVVLIFSFNYSNFAAKPIFGYSLYLTKDESNLLLVKDGAYTSETSDFQLGSVKSAFPKIGKFIAFIENKLYFVFVLAGIWLAGMLLNYAAFYRPKKFYKNQMQYLTRQDVELMLRKKEV